MTERDPKHEVLLYEKGSREEEAELSLKNTLLTRPMAWALLGLFLLTILFEPAFQNIMELRRNAAQRERETRTFGRPTTPLAPQVYDVFSLLPSTGRMRRGNSWWDALAGVAEITRYENTLKEGSVTSSWLLPRTQEILTGVGGAGNEKAYIGRDGWLFYRPEIDYITGKGVLIPSVLRQRARSGIRQVQPDPRKAILEFRDQLAARGIRLIVMPVPSKAVVHPEMFSARFAGSHSIEKPLQNPSYRQFIVDLEKAGILVFDPTDDLMAAKTGPLPPAATSISGACPQFLVTDTHWRPEAMERVAERLAAFIKSRNLLPAASPVRFKRVAEKASNLGDIAVMLTLPDDQAIFARQDVTIHPVLSNRNEYWQASASADVLLLGDSYSNIYSLESMGWGAGAGFAENLSYALRRPMDRLVRNDAGAHATRGMLVREQARGRDRLAGKKLVIWEFAVRELSTGDWKRMELRSPSQIEQIRLAAEKALAASSRPPPAGPSS